MALVFKQLDSFAFSGRGHVNFACAISEDDRIFMLSDIGVYVVALKPNLDSNFAQFSCQKSFFPYSNFSICENVDLDINTFIHELPRELLYESIARVELSLNMNRACPIEPLALSAQWSSCGMAGSSDCLLGVLTQLYNLEIYMKTVNESNITEYRIILNLSKELIERKKVDFVYSNKLPPVQKYKELKKRIEFVAPIAFCWSHTFTTKTDRCAVVFVGHFHGFISVWKIFSLEPNEKEAKCVFIGRHETTVGDISCLYWHKTQAYGGALCIGDMDGKIAIVQVTNLEANECICDNEVQFCQNADHRVDKLTMMHINEYTVLVAVKQCYLLFYGINGYGKVVDFTVHNVDNLYITGLSEKANKLRVLTFTGAFKELTLSIHYNKICVDDKAITIKLDSTGFRTHGFVETKNQALTGLFLNPYRLTNSVKGKQFVNFHIFHNSNLNPLQILIGNDSGSLAKYWDCIEALRLICLKEQRFPWLGLDPQLDYDSLSLHKLKTLRVIAKISETVFTVVKEVMNYDIKPFILLHYLVDIKLIVRRLNRLFDDIYSGKELSPFQLTSMELQLFFLKEAVMSGILLKAEVGRNFIEEMSHVLHIGNEMRFPDMIQCKLCGEKLIGATCVPPHADSRCCLSMYPIFITSAHKCNICGSLAHNEAVSEINEATCPYCDVPMQKICVKQSIIDELNQHENNEEVKSQCYSDCATDFLEYADLGDDAIEVTVISEDEEEGDGKDLNKMYLRVSKLNLEDTSNNWHIDEC